MPGVARAAGAPATTAAHLTPAERQASLQWSVEEERAFENALARHIDEPDTEQRWERVASAVGHKSAIDCKRRYELLVEDVRNICAGRVPMPNYSNSDGVRCAARERPHTRRNRARARDIRRHSARAARGLPGAAHASRRAAPPAPILAPPPPPPRSSRGSPLLLQKEKKSAAANAGRPNQRAGARAALRRARRAAPRAPRRAAPTPPGLSAPSFSPPAPTPGHHPLPLHPPRRPCARAPPHDLLQRRSPPFFHFSAFFFFG